MIYAALLRGINVGGNNKINMKLLKSTFEQAGMTRVTTYINSGNIIFASELSAPELSVQLEQAIAADFQRDIPVMVRSLPEMEAVIAAVPENWTNDEQMKSDVLFLWDDINNSSVLEQIPLKPEMGTLLYIPGALLVSVPRENVTRSGMNKLAASKLYRYMTIRNVNTTRQIYRLMLAAGEQEGT
ncbi:DUF1697 domain-containing protein [Paenibacillus bovis]|uniref:DUF1697 domain-containing protein n=1 Tax=Paenibacillus bovis TaxID=1616788 RepID=A0A172ZK18_9BACL|nr:DUF1697 domain-containing protein [Paenibacillus bovis]ANF97883.1 hypothetical protein AR543_18915 [Paenibacillus bovis]